MVLGDQTQFWEAAIAVMPLLALTIVLEFRALRWKLLGRGLRITLAIYMLTSMAMLGTSLMYSLYKLMTWGEPNPLERPWDAPVVIVSIGYAVLGVMLAPVSLTLMAAIGPVAQPGYANLLLDRAEGNMKYQLLNRELLARRHETRLELVDRVLSDKGRLFVAPSPGAPPRLADGKAEALFRESLMLGSRIAENDAAYRQWQKRINRKIRKARKRYPVQKTSDVIWFFSEESRQRH
jgi:hypothetical protein